MIILNQNNPVFNQTRLMNITVLPTLDCNIACNYCIHKCKSNIFYKDIKGKLSIENILKLKSFLEYYRHPDIDLNIQISGGEPTIDWQYFYDYISILDLIKNKNIEMVTNFSREYTKDEMIFLGSVFNRIVVSMDGMKESHNKGREDYDRVMSNLRWGASLFPGKFSVNMAVTEDNVSSFYENKRFFDHIGIPNSFNIDFYNPKKDERYFVNELMRQIDKLVKTFGSFSFLPFPIYGENWYCMDKNLALTVYPNGKLLHCNIEYDEDKMLYNLNKENYLEPLNNFDKVNTHKIVDKACLNCEALSFCKNGCYASFKQSREVFCSIMVGIARMRKKYEGEYK